MKTGHLFVVVYKGNTTTHAEATLIVSESDINKVVSYIPTGVSGNTHEIASKVCEYFTLADEDLSARPAANLRKVYLYDKGLLFAKVRLTIAGEYKI